MQRLLLIIFTLIFVLNSRSEAEFPEIGASNFGNEFIVSMPPNLMLEGTEQESKINFYLYSPIKATIKIEVPWKGFSEEIKLEPYERKMIDFDIVFAQAVVKNGFEKINDDIVLKNAGIRFSSSQAFALVVLSDFPETSDAFLALPTETLGKKYVVSSYQDQSDRNTPFEYLPSAFTIIGTKDETEVEVFVGGRSSSLEGGFSKIGRNIKKTLNKGDVWLLSSEYEGEDLSGSVITANKQVGVISANQCAEIPLGNPMCDFIAEFELPVKYWGKSYLVSQFAQKRNLPIIRVYPSEDSTYIFKNGVQIGFLDNLGKSTDKPFLEIVDTSSTEPYFLSSNNPIKVTAYSRGFNEDSSTVSTHNPFMVTLSPLERFQKEIYFSTPNSGFHPPFPKNNYLNLLINDNNKEISENLEIGKIYNNKINWEKLKESEYIYSAKNTSTTFADYQVLTLKLPNPGEFKLRSDKNFSALLYGTDKLKSYGYNASLSLDILGGLDTLPPKVEWVQSCNGIISGTIEDETIPLGTTLLSDWNNFKSNLNISDKSQMPVRWSLEAIDKNKTASATISFWDGFKNRTTVEVFYKPVDIKIHPKKIDFGEVSKGEIARQNLTITNNSDSSFVFTIENDSPVNILDQAGNEIQSVTIPALSTKIFVFELKAESDTTINDIVFLKNNCIGEKEILVEAIIGSPLIEVTDLSFQDITIGTERHLQAHIRNKGNRELEIYGYDFPSASNISFRDLPNASYFNPFYLAPNDEIEFTVEIDALEVDDFEEVLAVKSNADEIDSLCVINYRVINPGLLAEAYNWQRGKIDVNGYEFGPYESSHKLYLRNYGNIDLTITDWEIVYKKNQESFIFEDGFDDLFKNRKIRSGQNFEFDVDFDPIALDTSQITIAFTINNTETAKTRLNIFGFGTRPKAELKFKKEYRSFIDSENPVKGSIRIENLSSRDWKYADLIEYLSISYDRDLASEIGFSIGGFVAQDIPSGGFLEIPVSLSPEKVGNFKLPILIKTEAILDSYEIELIADISEIELGVSFLDDNTAKACSGENDTLEVEIENLSNEIITLEPLSFAPITNNFSFVEFNNIERKLNPNEKLNLKIEYTSTGSRVETDLVIKIKDQLKENRYQLIGENKLIESAIIVSPNEQNAKINSTIGNMVKFEIDDVNVSLKEVLISIRYDPSFIFLEKQDIFINQNIDNNFALDNFRESQGRLDFNIYSIYGEPIPFENELFGISYDVLLPTDSSEVTSILVEASTIDNNCFDFSNSGKTQLNIISECDDEYRRITSSGIEFFIDEIVPNPISEDKEFNFGIGIESDVTIEIIDTSGELVSTIFDSYIQAGEYSFILPVSDMQSGVYVLRISALDWQDFRQFVVHK